MLVSFIGEQEYSGRKIIQENTGREISLVSVIAEEGNLINIIYRRKGEEEINTAVFNCIVTSFYVLCNLEPFYSPGENRRDSESPGLFHTNVSMLSHYTVTMTQYATLSHLCHLSNIKIVT